MGRPPAYIFIVRHGNRLDAADKLWHLSSPTPYDPPLTYGGWTQCRALGQRIADILRANTPADAPSGEPARPRKRRYRIVIHSSPFLRCIQTSIAISSGIASDTLPLEPLAPLSALRQNNEHGTHAGGGNNSGNNSSPRLHKSVLRLDAFLGEWLSPSYFELITPPPSSVLMIASAKAELLRREDYLYFTHPTNTHTTHHHAHSHSTSQQPTSQLWGASRPSGMWTQGPNSGPPSATASPLLLPVGRPMSSSSSGGAMHSPVAAGYVAPVPHFALSSRAPVPTGYVAHARDACVDFDYQWDSMRPPYDWGDGGEFGEEWTAMHRRFRKGVQKLVDWYTTSDAPAEMVTKTIHFKTGTKKTNANGSVVDDGEFAIDSSDDEDDDDGGGADTDDSDCIEESIVILVSHGAGCNALIGAITKEPVLMDVGLASLSVAVRRPGREEAPVSSPHGHHHHSDAHTARWTGAVHSGHPGGLVPLDKYYEMKMLANSDHLRSVPTTPTTPRPNAMASVMGITRGRHSNSLSGTPGNPAQFDSGYAGYRSTSAGSMRGAGDVPARRPSGTSSRPAFAGRVASGTRTPPNVAVSRPSGGGSAATVFAPPPPTISTSQAGGGHAHARTPSVGLWSPVSSKDLDDDSFALTDGGDDGNDSDMELLLSFDRGQQTTSPPPPPAAPPAPAPKLVAPFVPAPLPKKKAPSIKSTNSRYPSSLSIAHSANGDDDDGDNHGSSRTGGKTDAEASLDKAVRAGLPQLDIKAATAAAAAAVSPAGSSSRSPATASATAKATAAAASRSASPGLWSHPRVVSINSDELAHENALSKRRWTVTERPL